MEWWVAIGYAAGGSFGWWLMDKFYAWRDERRAEREAQMRNVTPR